MSEEWEEFWCVGRVVAVHSLHAYLSNARAWCATVLLWSKYQIRKKERRGVFVVCVAFLDMMCKEEREGGVVGGEVRDSGVKYFIHVENLLFGSRSKLQASSRIADYRGPRCRYFIQSIAGGGGVVLATM